MDWCRLYGAMLDDPKIGQLDDAQFRTWIELLMAATKADAKGNTKLTPEESSINWSLRRNATVTLHELFQRELIALNECGEIVITDWEVRQKSSDSSTSRVAKHRENQRLSRSNATVTLQKRDSNGLEENREEESRENKKRIDKKRSDVTSTPLLAERSARSTSETRSTRLPTDWVLPEAWGTWALGERPDWDDARMRKIAEQFRDYWLAQGGATARKADWQAAWRIWVRREKSYSEAAQVRASKPAQPSSHFGIADLDFREGVSADGRF